MVLEDSGFLTVLLSVYLRMADGGELGVSRRTPPPELSLCSPCTPLLPTLTRLPAGPGTQGGRGRPDPRTRAEDGVGPSPLSWEQPCATASLSVAILGTPGYSPGAAPGCSHPRGLTRRQGGGRRGHR